MVAPLDAKATFEVGGETVTRRLNFRSIALAEEHGINLLSADGIDLSPTKAAIVVKCLAVQEHPDFTEDHSMAIVATEPGKLTEALISLFRSYGGKSEGNGTGGKPKAPR